MPQIELTAVQAKITLNIDSPAFRAALRIDSTGAKFVPVTIKANGQVYRAALNAKSFRKAQAAFQEAGNPLVAISGNLNGDVIESAGIQVFEKAAKPAETAPEPTPAPQAQAQAENAAPSGAGLGRPKLGLKPKAGG